MAIHSITVTVNGACERLEVPASMTLLQMLRETLALTGTKNGCEAGECGACTVLVDGEPVNSCMMLAVEADGKQVLTVEGLERDGRLHPLQQAFLERHAFQCGYCTGGMMLNAYALLLRNPRPTRAEIVRHMDDNLCRCGSHVRILDAIEAAARAMTGGAR